MNEIGDSLKRNGLLIWLGRMDAIFVAEQYKKKKRGVAWPTVLRMMGIRVDGKEGEGNGTKVLLGLGGRGGKVKKNTCSGMRCI